MKISKQLIVSTLILSAIIAAPLLVLAQTALTASITAPSASQTLSVGQAVTFTGSASGGNATFYSYVWNFGDGTFGAGSTFSKTYNSAGSYPVTLTVADHDGSQASISRTVTVTGGGNPGDTTAPTAPVITSATPSSGSTATSPATTITWSASTDAGGLAGYSYLWDNNPTTNPDHTVDSTGLTLNQNLSNGTWYFHIIAVDNAGNVSTPTTHYGPITIQSATTPVAPVISNIRVDGITQTSVVIHWDTNIPADSRVIYDTVSHPTLGSAPNFGYAFSSDTFDTTTKVTTHTVTLTGLTPNTQYFFRVLSQS